MRTDDFDFARFEQAAAAQARGLASDPMSWPEILAAAQFAINEGIDVSLDQAVSRLLVPENIPLVAASRMLVSSLPRAASEPTQEIDNEVRRDILFLAAAAFALHGNFPSSGAVVSQILTANRSMTAAEALFLAVISPRHIGQLLHFLPSETRVRAVIESLAGFLRTADSATSAVVADGIVASLIQTRVPFEKVLLGTAAVAFKLVEHLSTAATFRQLSNSFPPDYLDKLLTDGVSLLLPPQSSAILDQGLIESTGNALISFPTSTGKTMLGEMAMMSSLRTGPGLAVYVAPYVALASQVYRSIRRRAPEQISVQAQVGGYAIGQSIDPVSDSVIVIATPERFDALLRNQPSLREHLRCVVVDEAHIIGNDIRGLRLEGLVTRLRLLQETGAAFRMVCLSAVIGDPGSLLRWLGELETKWITTTWRPTARRLAYWSKEGQLAYLVGDDPLRRPNQTNTSSYASQTLPWPEPGLHPPRNFGDQRYQHPLVYRNIAYLVEVLLNQRRGSVLCVSATKAGTRGIAYRIADRLSELEPVPDIVGRAIGVIQRRYPYLAALATCLGRGVAYHNAGLPHEVRQLIEGAAQSGELRAVAATTTLAEGVDLPFYFTVVADWLTWSGDGQILMDPLLFRNVAGRSGRAGYHTEGETIVFDNPVGDIRLTGPQVRRSNQRNVFLLESPPPLLSVAERTEVADSPALSATLGSQFMAAIPENPTTDDLAAAFAGSSFLAARGADITPILSVCRAVEGDLLDARRGAFATAASPLALTPLGTAANATGLSPQSCRVLLDELRRIGPSAAVGPELASTLLIDLAGLPELSNDALRKKLMRVPRARHPVAPEDLDPFFDGWLQGAELEELFVQLAFVMRSSRRSTLEPWLAGNAPESSWYEDFDKFVDFVTGAVCAFLPWMLRSCSQLESHTGGPFSVDWGTFGDLLEHGVDSRVAVSFLLRNAPVARRTLVVLGKHWPEEWPDDEVGFLAPRTEAREAVEAIFDRAVAEAPDVIIGNELRSLFDWYTRVPIDE